MLSIGGIPNTEIRTELVVAFTHDLSVAQNGDIALADQIRKVLYTTGDCDPQRNTTVQYDCMTGFDISAGEDTFDKVYKKLEVGEVCVHFQNDEVVLPAFIIYSLMIGSMFTGLAQN